MPGPTELLIILAIILLIFGGTKLAGLGKASGKAIREFREETRGLGTPPEASAPSAPPTDTAPAAPDTPPPLSS